MRNDNKTLKDYLPSGPTGVLALNRLAASIDKANSLSADRWGLSLLRTLIRLNLGMIEVVTLSPDELRLVLDWGSVPDELPDVDAMLFVVGSEDDPFEGVYPSVPGSAICEITLSECTQLPATLLALEQSHLTLLRNASLTTRNPKTKTGHSVSGIRAISTRIRRELPQPRYAKDDS